jgi:arsenical pump membrane protein
VTGLLLVGYLADREGVFSALGEALARITSGAITLFIGAMALVAVTTALLNLDTSVAFLTPVLVYAARSRSTPVTPLLYGCVLVSNAASTLLPGSNLTNLIVVGRLHLAGSAFLARTGPAWLASVVLTSAVVAGVEWSALRTSRSGPDAGTGPGAGTRSTGARVQVGGAGPAAVALSAAAVLFLPDPALWVLAIGLLGVVWLSRHPPAPSPLQLAGEVGLPVLVLLFAVSVGLGTLARHWSGPTDVLAHVDRWGTAGVAAAASVLVNNLPAASLLSAHVPRHPFAMMAGLDIGPNLLATGSLAWFLWYQVARRTGAAPSLGRACLIGALSVPAALAAAVALLS